jgi:hypothetical protein
MTDDATEPLLTDDDAAYLEGKSWRYDATRDADGWTSLVIYDYPLPPGYNATLADLLLRLPAGFPDAAPDMFWLHPVVLYANGAEPQATTERFPYAERVWQRWSRHLAIAWRPGIDDLRSYLRLIRSDLIDGASAAQAGLAA